MKHSLVGTVGTLALVLSVAGVAEAQWTHCGIRGLEGSWAYTETGTVVLPSTGATAATMAVGRYTFDRDGTFTAIQWGSTAGSGVGVPSTKKGTYTVNEDCTITMKIDGYDANGNWVRYSEWQIVLADNGKEMRGISLKLLFAPPPYPTTNPPSLDLKPVMTMTGTWVSGRGEEREQRDQR